MKFLILNKNQAIKFKVKGTDPAGFNKQEFYINIIDLDDTPLSQLGLQWIG